MYSFCRPRTVNRRTPDFASFLQKPKDTFDADNRIDTLALEDDSEDIQEMTYRNSEQQQDNEHINGHTPADVPASYEVAELTMTISKQSRTHRRNQLKWMLG